MKKAYLREPLPLTEYFTMERFQDIFDKVKEVDIPDPRIYQDFKTKGIDTKCWVIPNKSKSIYSKSIFYHPTERVKGNKKKQNMYNHRLFYAVLNGTTDTNGVFTPYDIAGKYIDHLCCNPQCMQVSHLEPVSMEENTRRVFKRMELDILHMHKVTGKNKIANDSSGFNFEDIETEDLFSMEPEQTVLETDLLVVVSTRTVHHTNLDSAVLEQVDTDRERYKDILFTESVTDDFIIDAGEFTYIFDQL